MAYTVQEAANLSGTTVKTLYHYQKVGLLFPHTVGDNGYRYYTDKELERLQQIQNWKFGGCVKIRIRWYLRRYHRVFLYGNYSTIGILLKKPALTGYSGYKMNTHITI